MPLVTTVSIARLRQSLQDGEQSVAEHVLATLNAIAERDPELGAYVAVAGEGALRAAEQADRLVSKHGRQAWHGRPLLGVTVSVKDLIQTADLPTRRGSLLPNTRGDVDAPLVARLRAAGAVIVGKTATCEGGWCGSTRSRLGPATRNPWNPARSSGGSSGGAAASVAAGLCDAAIGTDGAGSIRIPASFCGVVGFKPTFGTVPYVPACADRLAHAGPIVARVADAMELMAALAGPHPADPDSLLVPSPAAPERIPGPLRVAWIEFPDLDAEVERVTAGVPDELRALGHSVDRIAVPFPDPGTALVDLLAAAEAAGTTPDMEELADPARLAVVRHGRTVRGTDLIRAEEVRMALRIRMAEVMTRYDLLAMPTVPVEPFGVEEIGPPWAADPADLAWLKWTPATYPFNLTGQPAVSLPAGLSRTGMPVGVQLVGPVGGDSTVLAAARELESRIEPLSAATAATAART